MLIEEGALIEEGLLIEDGVLIFFFIFVFGNQQNMKNDIFAKTFEEEVFHLKELCCHSDITIITIIIEKLRARPLLCTMG